MAVTASQHFPAQKQYNSFNLTDIELILNVVVAEIYIQPILQMSLHMALSSVISQHY